MPKRSNEFQRLIKRIYEQLADSSSGEIVTESAIINDLSTGAPREVDVLIEREVVGHTIRIAVECRSRDPKGKSKNDKQDIEWIDQLRGKYATLPIDKVIAVSQTGFTRKAHLQAQNSNIDLLTLEEANELNWPAQFIRLKVAGHGLEAPQLYSIGILTEPEWLGELDVSAELFDSSGEVATTLLELAEFVLWYHSKNIYEDIKTQYLDNNFVETFKTLDEAKNSFIKILLTHRPLMPLFIRSTSKGLTKIVEVSIEASVKFIVKDIPLTYGLLGETLVSQGIINSDNDKAFNVAIIQSPNRANEAKVWWDLSTKK